MPFKVEAATRTKYTVFGSRSVNQSINLSKCYISIHLVVFMYHEESLKVYSLYVGKHLTQIITFVWNPSQSF